MSADQGLPGTIRLTLRATSDRGPTSWFRCATRCGSARLTCWWASDGALSSLPGAMFGYNADPAVRAAWLNDMFLPPDVLEWALNVVVVRSGGRTDTHRRLGWGWSSRDSPRAGRLAQRLGGRRHRSRIRDRRGTYPHAHGPRWRAARRRGEGPVASGPAGPPGGRRGRVLGARPISPASPCRRGSRGCASADGQAVLERVPQPDADVRDRVRGGAGGGRSNSHRRPHPLGHSVVRRACGGDRLTFAGDAVFPGRVRTPRLVQRLRTRPRGGGPRPGRSFAGVGGEPRAAGGHSPVVPVRLPCGVRQRRRRRLSLGTGLLGILTAC